MEANRSGWSEVWRSPRRTSFGCRPCRKVERIEEHRPRAQQDVCHDSFLFAENGRLLSAGVNFADRCSCY